jgi:TIR domain/Sel1 repeat
MADVFISYRREDRPKAEALYKALIEEGLDVWWDKGLQAGETFDEKIQQILQTVKAVVLLWSPAAVGSEWVRGEGTIGRERGILVPVMVKPVNIPVPFNLIHTADLSGWSGDRSDPTYQGVVTRVKKLAAKEHVKPLKPPPNRAMRRLWQAIAAVAVIAVAGASVWFFKPWEALAAANDPALKAQRARDASMAKLADLGIQPNDFTQYDWKQVAFRRFNADKYADLVTLSDGGNPLAQALRCAVEYWSPPGVQGDNQKAWENCRKSSEQGERIGQAYNAYLLNDRSFMSNDEEQKRIAREEATAEFKKAADQGFAWAQLAYGYRLEEGIGVTADWPRAVELYKAAQAQDVPAADYALGSITLKGLVEGHERLEGVLLVEKAADKGYPIAMYEIAGFYRDGFQVPKDYEKARRYLDMAAAQKDDDRLAERARGMIQSLNRQIEQEKQEGAAPTEGAAPPPN